MAKPSKKPTPSIAEKEDRVRNAVRVLGEALDNYEQAHPHWRIEHWSPLINGASVDSRLKRSRKLKGPQNCFELVGQFEALISSD